MNSNYLAPNLYLPTDPDAERSLIATLIAAPRLLHEMLPILESDDMLTHPAYRALLGIIREIHEEGKPMKLMSVVQRMRASGQEKILTDNHVSLISIASEAREVDCLETAHYLRGMWIKRNAVESATALIQAVARGDSATDIVDRMTKATQVATHSQSVGADRSMADILSESLAIIDRASQQKDGITGVHTGLAKLDRHFGGWQNSDVIMIAGRPGMGKSVAGLCHTMTAAHTGVPVAFLSLEMSATSLCNRAYSSQTGIEYGDIKKGRIAPHEWNQMHHATQKLASLPIHFYDDANRDVNDLSAKLLYWKQKYGIGLVVIDYVQLMTDRTVKGDEFAVLTSVSKKLKQLQRRMECPLIELAQLSRGVENRPGSKRPVLSDLRSTGQFEQDASVVIMLYREDYYIQQAEKEQAEKENRPYCHPAPNHRLEYGIVKNRDGDTGTAELWCDVATNRLFDGEPVQKTVPRMNLNVTVASTQF